MVNFWLILMVMLGIIEGVTSSLVTIWFAGGALCASIAAVFKLNYAWQASIFLAVSVILLVTTRPVVKKIMKGHMEKTNADRVIGQKVIITERVDNIAATGKTMLNGVEWTVRSAEDAVIEEGKIVTVEKIEGVKLIVSE